MPRDIDALSSPTLKHLRDSWWDEGFTTFLKDTLQPRAGSRILDVGCGTGTPEVQLSRLRLSQVRLYGVDVLLPRVKQAVNTTKAHNIRARYAAADACRLPFATGVFDSAFCIAVLQHVRDVGEAVGELARVTKPTGRILAVEPDNRARYWYSSVDSGMRAFDLATRLFASLGDATDPVVGPRLPGIFASKGIEPTAVELFPVTVAHLGPPARTIWENRRKAVQAIAERASQDGVRKLATEYLELLGAYAKEAAAAGPSFVEIQNTLLFATVGKRAEA